MIPIKSNSRPFLLEPIALDCFSAEELEELRRWATEEGYTSFDEFIRDATSAAVAARRRFNPVDGAHDGSPRLFSSTCWMKAASGLSTQFAKAFFN